jgi:CHAD domain-containing protein
VLAGVKKAVEPRLRVVAGPARGRHRTCLDTFDWRLHRKGMTCELQTTAGADRRLVLGVGSTRVETPMPEGAPPLKVADLPVGGIRDRLAAVIDIRALLPLAEADEAVCDARVLDRRDKTVVRLVVEAANVVPSGKSAEDACVQLDPHVRVMPVRGYADAAKDVSSALNAAGIAASRDGSVPAIFHAAGLHPGRKPGIVDPAPEPQTPAAVAVASMLRSYLDQLEANVPGACQDIDTEYVHDLRIAVRRSRSALKLTADVFPEGASEHYGAELKWLGDVTTPVRDLDVHLMDLPKLAARLDAFSAEDLDAFGEHLRRHRLGTVDTMASELTSPRYEAFVTAWRALLDSMVEQAASGPGADVTVAELAADRVTRANRRVVKLGSRITPDSPADDLHTLRKRAKELRYVIDLFQPVLDARHAKALVKKLKGLQDVLGAHQDSEVQREALRTFATEMVVEESSTDAVPVRTLLAIGELATHLEADQREARTHFEETFAAFVHPTTRRHLDALVKGSERTAAKVKAKARTSSGKARGASRRKEDRS